MKHSDARTDCQSRGGDLAVVTSEAESNTIMANAVAANLDVNQLWLGGLVTADGVVTWVDGTTTVDFGFPWAAGEPTSRGADGCIALDTAAPLGSI
jgi:hypothetical protein